MSDNLLNAEPRNVSGKGFARRLRMIDRIPGVFYYAGKDNIPLSLDLTNLKVLLRSKPRLINLAIEGMKSRECIIREMQRDPVTDEILHVDFLGIKRGTKVRITVPVILHGVPKGVKNDGGILQRATKELEIECLPKDIPSSIDIDVSELRVGDVIHVGTLEFPAYNFITGAKVVVALVIEPVVSKTTAEMDAEAAEIAEEEAGEGGSEE